jgi:hypothetical protein
MMFTPQSASDLMRQCDANNGGAWHNDEFLDDARLDGSYDFVKLANLLNAALFRAEHGVSDAEFLTDHWQTLFAIQYPEARS